MHFGGGKEGNQVLYIELGFECRVEFSCFLIMPGSGGKLGGESEGRFFFGGGICV